MYFGLSEDQVFFQDNVKKYLEDNAPLDIIRKIIEDHESIYKKDIHKGIVNLGINNLLIPEENGGLGLNLLFATAISQSLGEALAPIPFFGAYVMAPIAINYGGSKDQINTIFNEMSNGKMNFGISFSEYFGSRGDSKIIFSNGKVNGTTLFALDCDHASHLLVSNSNGVIGSVSLDSQGIECVDLITVDKTRVFKEINFNNVTVEVLEKTLSSTTAIEKSLDAGRIVTAADSLGAAQAMIDKAVSYSKERKQFNRAIGSFQAVKHMCAEMVAELEPCYSLVWHAAHSFDKDENDARLMACHAKSHVSDVSKKVSKKATEVHGGMGFTDLLGLHFWFKRIGLNRQLLGAPEIIRSEAAKIQGL